MTYELAIFIGGLFSGMWVAIQIQFAWEADIQRYESILRKRRGRRFPHSARRSGRREVQWRATDGPGFFSRN